MRGLEIEIRQSRPADPAILVLRLKDQEQRGIFLRLCLDIVSAVGSARSEAGAVECFVGRTLRWHRLLKGGRDGRLSDEEQKGLLGELVVLRDILFSCVGVQNGLKAWTGPLNTPKDFEIGRICIEAKARRGAAKPFVAISSEDQLDTTSIDALFLHVSEITSATDEDGNAVTVTDMAKDILERVVAESPAHADLFEGRLLAAGFDWADDYTDCRWLLGPHHVYEVAETFPRIVRSGFLPGVEGVRYSVSLQDCESFRKCVDSLKGELNEVDDGNER